MIGAGCALGLCALGFLVSGGGLLALRHGGSSWAGMGWGVTAWITAMAGYGAWLTIVDWWQAEKYPNRKPDPLWLVPLVWVVFVAGGLVTITVGRHVFGW